MTNLFLSLFAAVAAAGSLAAAQPAITSFAATPASADELTLFAFDTYSLPFASNLYLTMHPVKKYPGNPILRRGAAGTPDEYGPQLYGSVMEIDGKYRMWYLGCTPETVAGMDKPIQDFHGFFVCYAESEDGLSWTRPNLGLVEYHGNRNNNLVEILSSEGLKGNLPGPGNVLVLFEPQDPDPAHRYKMMLLVEPSLPKNINNILPLYSADGLHWRQAVPGRIDDLGNVAPEAVRLPLDHFEMGGLYRFQGTYYVTGQQETPYFWLPDGSPIGRAMTVFHSADFIHWSETRARGFIRWGYRSAPVNEGEEVHMPAASWNRDNVLLGLFGQFHGSATSKLHPLDLGLLLSNDGIHFREAMNDYAFIPHDPKTKWESGGVVQGQAFLNIGDETYIYYCGWDGDVTDPATHSEIGLARLRRDGFGSVSPRLADRPAALETCLLTARVPAHLWLNVEGISPDASLQVELLDEAGGPVPGFAGADAAEVTQSGTRVPVRWKRGATFDLRGAPFHFRVKIAGSAASRVSLYALYVGR